MDISAFNSWFACGKFTQEQHLLINKGGYDGIKACRDYGGIWSYGVFQAFPGCQGCMCCTLGNNKDIVSETKIYIWKY